MSSPRDANLQIRDLDTGVAINVEEYARSKPPVVHGSPTPSIPIASRADIPKHIEFSAFIKHKKAPFYHNPVIVQVFTEHRGCIRCLGSSLPDGALIASGGEDGTVVLYQFHGHLAKVRQFHGHQADVTCIAFSSENFIISGSLDSTVRLWHPSNEKELRVFQHEEAVTAVAAHPTDAAIFMACTFGNAVWVWHIRDSAVIQTINFVSPPTAATFSPDGQTIAIGCYNGFCFFYAMPDFRYVTQFIAGPRRKKRTSNKKVTSIVFRNATQFFVSTNDSRIRLYSSDNFSVIRKYLGHVSEQANQRVSYSAKCDLRLSGSEKGGGVFIWPVEHEQFFQSWVSAFSRDRSTTFEGILLGKKTFVTAAMFTSDATLEKLSMVVTDTEGHVFLIVSE
jgi:WD40 repeat protein